MQWLVNRVSWQAFSVAYYFSEDQTSRVRPPQFIQYFHKKGHNVLSN